VPESREGQYGGPGTAYSVSRATAVGSTSVPAYSPMVPASGNPMVGQSVGSNADPMSLRLTCFDSTDKEVRQLVISRSLTFSDMTILLTDMLKQPAMMAYDNGVGVDLPVRSDADWEAFLSMLERETILNREYDILVLPEGTWKAGR